MREKVKDKERLEHIPQIRHRKEDTRQATGTMTTDSKSQEIDLKAVFRRIMQKKWRLLMVAVVAFAAACVIILPVPRYYTCAVELAPELGVQSGGGGLADIASSMGINLNDGMMMDAISPELYPELMKSNDYVVSLIDCPVKSKDGTISTTYYTYLAKYHKSSPWAMAMGAVKKLFTFKKKTPGRKPGQKPDPFMLTKQEDDIFNAIKTNIKCSVDKKTNVITIVVTDQDPLIAATMSRAAMQKLQDFIIKYRTTKARNDVAYYRKLTGKAKASYEKARQLYGSYSDANMDVMLESFKSKQADLENDMQLKFNTYSTLNTQLQASLAKLQERTPAFTVLKSPSVPIKPAGPKRMIFVLGVMVMAIAAATAYYSKDLLL